MIDVPIVTTEAFEKSFDEIFVQQTPAPEKPKKDELPDILPLGDWLDVRGLC